MSRPYGVSRAPSARGRMSSAGQLLERYPDGLVRAAALPLAVGQERMVGPAARAEAPTHDPGVVVEEDRAAERLLVHERPQLDLDAELLDRLAAGRLLGRLAVLDATAREEVVGMSRPAPAG